MTASPRNRIWLGIAGLIPFMLGGRTDAGLVVPWPIGGLRPWAGALSDLIFNYSYGNCLSFPTMSGRAMGVRKQRTKRAKATAGLYPCCAAGAVGFFSL